tara:strand:- start:14433 stop:16193 length:1761 start_codon:yes stop_codon:yes gene_type:complete
MTDIIYQHKFLNENDPIANQPSKIITTLKPHQLTSLFKAVLMEQQEYIKYLHDDRLYSVYTNIGLLGDIVGYGKTLSALSIIASSDIKNFKISDEYIKTYFSSKKSYNSMIVKSTFHDIPNLSSYIQSTLVIVPRGPVYLQWENTLETQTKLKYLAIENLKSIKKLMKPTSQNIQEVIDYFNSFDLILIKNTNLKQFFDYFRFETGFIRKWARIMIDEVHDILNTLPTFEYLFMWMISGTYNLISNRNLSNMANLRDIIHNELSHILVKGNPEYVRKSFDIPPYKEIKYYCKLASCLSALRSFLSQNVIDRLNTSDLSGAVREMGGTSATVECMIGILTHNLTRNIHNKKCEITHIQSLQLSESERQSRLISLQQQLLQLENNLNDLKTRLIQIDTRICSICMDTIQNPIVLNCTHYFCSICLFQWLKNKTTCPECRSVIDNKNLISIDNDANDTSHTNREKKLSKEDTLINILNSKDGKFLIFTKLDNSFSGVKYILNRHDISYAEIKGTTNCMRNILERFRNGSLKVILLNTIYAGSGIDISFATDVILYHNLGIESTTQAIARAQRYGRTTSLTVHQLLYEHE